MIRHQRGLGVISVFSICVVLVFTALFVMKVLPVWIDYLSIRKVLAAMHASEDLKAANPITVRQAFDRRADIDNIKAISAKDLEIHFDGQAYVVSFQYQSVIPLFANASLVFDFAGSSNDDVSLLPPKRKDE